MKSTAFFLCLLIFGIQAQSQLKADYGALTVKTENGFLQGTLVSGITVFKGVPFAQPPVGDLRWKEPQPVISWQGIRKADHFAARAMQLPVFSDMMFRSDGISEDCLYLNIWTPAKTGNEGLPVLVYFYGGGLIAGDGSEYRYDGESMARNGIISVTVNYRLGIFGFMAHPELTKESPHHASGNYGFMDQAEALRWVHKNIAAFGGNPDHVTIAGESAGSYSVSAQIISPVPRNLFSAAIGESGSLLGKRPIPSLKEAEADGVQFSEKLGVHSLKDLRALSADQILQAGAKKESGRDWVDVDGYFFPESPIVLYTSGRVAKVPLLVGWNSGEGGWEGVFGKDAPTRENYIKVVNRMYPKNAEEVLKLYTVKNDSDVQQVTSELTGDDFIGFSTWKWAELHAKNNIAVYRYYYTRPRPGLRMDINKQPSTPPHNKPGTYNGASHSAEIEYALGNLPLNRVYDWQPDDFLVSAVMQEYFVNFIKTRNPNGIGLPYWPLYQSWQKDPIQYIGVETHRHADLTRDRYLYWDKSAAK